MRVIIGVLLVALLVFGGFWWVSAREISARIETALRQSDAISATVGPVTGFPLHFDVTLAQPLWQDRARDAAWRSPSVSLRMPLYQPNQITITPAPDQMLFLNGEELALRAPDAQARTTIAPSLIVTDILADVPSLAVQLDGLTHHLRDLSLQMSHLQGATHHLRLDAQAAEMDARLHAGLGFPDALSPVMGRIHLEAELGFDAPISLTHSPALQHLHITSAALAWDALALSLTGALDVNAAGGFDGSLTLRVDDPQILLTMLIANGTLTPDMGAMASMLLASMVDPESGQTALPLSVNDSTVALGPFLLGILPRL